MANVEHISSTIGISHLEVSFQRNPLHQCWVLATVRHVATDQTTVTQVHTWAGMLGKWYYLGPIASEKATIDIVAGAWLTQKNPGYDLRHLLRRGGQGGGGEAQEEARSTSSAPRE